MRFGAPPDLTGGKPTQSRGDFKRPGGRYGQCIRVEEVACSASQVSLDGKLYRYCGLDASPEPAASKIRHLLDGRLPRTAFAYLEIPLRHQGARGCPGA